MEEFKLEESVKVFSLHKKGKERKIVSYIDGKGKKLRDFHKNILAKLEQSKSSTHSYAYKKGISTRDAIEPHRNSNLFIKIDIHNFFESIDEDEFYNKTINNEIVSTCKNQLQYCFYNKHLPLGFVTSPILSDMYMKSFDDSMEKFLNAHPSLRYSRYCDDILISTLENNFGELHTFYYFIEGELKKIGLSINTKKTKEIDLEKHGSVSFLGLNISRKQGKPQITISKTFILKTLDLIDIFYKLEEKNAKRYRFLKCVIKSRVSYIKHNSAVSYQKFLLKYQNKFHQEWNVKWH